MWLHAVSLAAAISLAEGMCFGVPLLRQSVACPETQVYYPQLCLCLEPKIIDRLKEIDSIRKVPGPKNGYMDRSQNFQTKIDAFRHRLTASLPDVSSHSFGSSVGDVRLPLIVFPDGQVVPNLKFFTLQNHVPRSWTIGGLPESWSKDALAAGEVPVVNTGGVFSPESSGWGAVLQDLSALSLMERLHSLRKLWQDATQSQATSLRGDTSLAQQFLKNLPTTGISPDTARSYLHYEAGLPDTNGHFEMKFTNSQKEQMKSSYLPIGSRPNSFFRGAKRLQTSAFV